MLGIARAPTPQEYCARKGRAPRRRHARGNVQKFDMTALRQQYQWIRRLDRHIRKEPIDRKRIARMQEHALLISAFSHTSGLIPSARGGAEQSLSGGPRRQKHRAGRENGVGCRVPSRERSERAADQEADLGNPTTFVFCERRREIRAPGRRNVDASAGSDRLNRFIHANIQAIIYNGIHSSTRTLAKVGACVGAACGFLLSLSSGSSAPVFFGAAMGAAGGAAFSKNIYDEQFGALARRGFIQGQ